MSGGDVATHPASFTIEDASGSPLVGVTFCSVPVGDCGTSNDHGRVLLNVPSGQTLINGFDDAYVRPTITFAAPGGSNSAHFAPRLLTAADLNAIYRSFGIHRSEGRGTVVVELVGEPNRPISGVLYDSREQPNTGVFITPGSADTSTRVYFLDVPPGQARVELDHDGTLCGGFDGIAWPSNRPGSVATLVFANTLTYAGAVQCL